MPSKNENKSEEKIIIDEDIDIQENLYLKNEENSEKNGENKANTEFDLKDENEIFSDKGITKRKRLISLTEFHYSINARDK